MYKYLFYGLICYISIEKKKKKKKGGGGEEIERENAPLAVCSSASR